MRDADFHFGTGGSCCGKPVGCNLPLEGCKYPQHPWKRAQRGEDVRCQAVGWVNGRGGPENRNQCVLRNGHNTGRHVGEKDLRLTDPEAAPTTREDPE